MPQHLNAVVKYSNIGERLRCDTGVTRRHGEGWQRVASRFKNRPTNKGESSWVVSGWSVQSPYEPGGRRFESCRARHPPPLAHGVHARAPARWRSSARAAPKLRTERRRAGRATPDQSRAKARSSDGSGASGGSSRLAQASSNACSSPEATASPRGRGWPTGRSRRGPRPSGRRRL